MPILPTEAEEKPNGWTATDIGLPPAPADDTVLSLSAMEMAFADWLADYKSVQSDAWRNLTPDEAATLTQAHWEGLLEFYESHLRQMQADLKKKLNRERGITYP